MGTPMVDRMLAAGIPVTVYARRSEVRDRFAAAGAPVVGDIAAVAAGNDVVISCLYSDAQVRELLLGERGLVAAMEPGSVLASHTTGSPATMRALAEAGAARDVHVVDAPVSGGTDDIIAGQLTVMLGGAPADRDRVRAVVAAYSSAIHDTGALGTAQAMKLVNNSLFAAHVQLACDAERVANELGIETARLVEVVHTSSGQSYALDALGGIGSAAALVAAAGHYMRKDVDAVKEVAAELGVDLGLLGRVADGDAVQWEARS
jgi:3-hydroxyisobutyrate dehydrogenase-like beta-hydroxyacid dehydrogenase